MLKKFPCRMTRAFCLPTRFQVHYTYVFLRPRRLFWAIWFRISTEEQKKGNISGAYHFEKATNCSWKWVIWKRKIGLHTAWCFSCISLFVEKVHRCNMCSFFRTVWDALCLLLGFILVFLHKRIIWNTYITLKVINNF